MQTEGNGPKTIGQMTDEIREVVTANGWRPVGGGPGDNTFGDYIALLHSEISEALEAYRTWRLDDATGKHLSADRDIDGPPKPEGVGSELADVMIRLLDMADVFGIWMADRDLTVGRVESILPAPLYPNKVETFGDHMAWLHNRASLMWQGTMSSITTGITLQAVVTVARKYGVDLDFEYRRKMAYNRTRGHGGRELSRREPYEEQVAAPTSGSDTDRQDYRYNALYFMIPTDPRDWWTGKDVGLFEAQWAALGLPALTLSDAEGEVLVLWTEDLASAAQMIGVELNMASETDPEIRIEKDEYVVCIGQARK